MAKNSVQLGFSLMGAGAFALFLNRWFTGPWIEYVLVPAGIVSFIAGVTLYLKAVRASKKDES